MYDISEGFYEGRSIEKIKSWYSEWLIKEIQHGTYLDFFILIFSEKKVLTMYHKYKNSAVSLQSQTQRRGANWSQKII